MTGRLLNVGTVLGLVGLLALVSMTAPRWAHLLRRPLEVPIEEPSASDGEPATPRVTPAPPGEATRTISVKLFFEAADRRGLVQEDRTVALAADLPRQIDVVLRELIAGSRISLLSPFNPTTRVLDVFVSAQGVAYVDLSKAAQEAELGGSETERLAVYSVVNTIIENFPAVRRVQILIEDRPVDTLAGHIDLTRPLAADLTLLADMQPPGSGASPTPSPSRGPIS